LLTHPIGLVFGEVRHGRQPTLRPILQSPLESHGLLLGEFWHGSVRAGHDVKTVSEFLAVGLSIIDPVPVIPVYAHICAKIQFEPVYKLIGQNDLWIASVAVALDKPLLSRNRRHFESIPNLRLEVLQP